MVRENAYSDNYNITIWPVELFNVPITEKIEYITYYFTNKDGSVTITQSDDDFVVKGTEIPTVKVPFQFAFECE